MGAVWVERLTYGSESGRGKYLPPLTLIDGREENSSLDQTILADFDYDLIVLEYF